MIPGIVLLAIGGVGIIVAVVMERRQHEPKWKLLMKIMPSVFAIGIALFIVAMRG